MARQDLTPSREDELMLCSARTFVNEKATEHIQALLRDGIDWPSLIQSAGRQGVLPLVYKTLKTRFSDSVPQQVFNELRTHYAANLGRNIMLTRELLRIVDLFEASGISPIPIKGPSLAVFAYGDLALRNFCDLDILVQTNGMEKVRKVLAANGYSPDLELPEQEEPRFLRFHFERAFGHDDRPILLEIHWALDYPYYSFAAGSERLWERCRTLVLEGRPILSLAAEDLLIYLCAHGARHRWQRLAWICDVAELIRICPSLDWGDIVSRAEQSGSTRMLALGLFLAYDLLGAMPPADIVGHVTSDRVVQALAGRVCEELFREPEVSFEGGDPEVNLFFIRTMSHLGDRAKGLLTDILIPNAFELGLLPSYAFVFPLYFLIRPIRLIGKTMRTALAGFL